MQDIIAIAVSLAAAAWLAWSFSRRLFAPPCQPPSAGPKGSDGFVPLGDLKARAKNRGAPAERPGSRSSHHD